MQDKDGNSALLLAAQCGNLDCIRRLLPVEGKITNKSGATALMVAATFN